MFKMVSNPHKNISKQLEDIEYRLGNTQYTTADTIHNTILHKLRRA